MNHCPLRISSLQPLRLKDYNAESAEDRNRRER